MDIQKLIEKYKAEWAKAKAESIYITNGGYEKVRLEQKGMMQAFAMILDDLLLLKDESKQPQPPDFANTMLGEVPHEVNAQLEDTTQAVEGATPVVRQNEQTKEVFYQSNLRCIKCKRLIRNCICVY